MKLKAKFTKCGSAPEEEITLPDGTKTLEALAPASFDILSDDGAVVGGFSIKLAVGGFMSGGLWLDGKPIPSDGVLDLNITIPGSADQLKEALEVNQEMGAALERIAKKFQFVGTCGQLADYIAQSK